MASPSVEDLRADLAELQSLRATAKRAKTLQVLDAAISSLNDEIIKVSAKPVPVPPAEPPKETSQAPSPAAAAATPPAAPTEVAPHESFVAIKSFGWDSGEYNHPWVTVYVTLEGVQSVKDQVRCAFTKDSFDLTVSGLKGKSYRLVKDNLEKDIIPEESKFLVKKDRISVKLKKVKGDFSYETWQNLTAKKGKVEKKKSKDDPMGGIMDLMKNMYDEGDDNMKKIIAESMMKARSGATPEAPDLGADMGI